MRRALVIGWMVLVLAPIPGSATSLHGALLPSGAQRQPAFPGAEGFGAYALGGRGGGVIEVTSLADAGPGTLRHAVEQRGPRTIVFRVGGTIVLSAPLSVENPFVTIAGQTAPGGGIAIRHDGSVTSSLVQIRTHDVIVRYLRIRPGPDDSARGSGNLDALTVTGPDAHDVIVDHVSMTWAVDETADVFGGAHDVTFQWSILAEGLACSNHQKTLARGGGECPGGGPSHSRGMTISTVPGGVAPDRVSLHHNLWAHNDRRHPNISSDTLVDFVNNVVYDFRTVGSRLGLKTPGGAVRLNFVKNWVAPGPETDAGAALFEVARGTRQGAMQLFLDGNELRGSLPAPEDDLAVAGHLVSERHPAEPITETKATKARRQVLREAGATLPRRDRVDRRIVREVRQGEGGLIDHPDDVGGWPVLKAGIAPDDADGDGMPDGWESEHGFDPADADDGSEDRDGDGYTNLEEFLNDTDPSSVDA